MKIKQMFDKVKLNIKPSIIFIDEIDTYSTDSLNKLLSEMDTFQQSDGIIVIAATNMVESINPALLR